VSHFASKYFQPGSDMPLMPYFTPPR
jgi:hypothetical protein